MRNVLVFFVILIILSSCSSFESVEIIPVSTDVPTLTPIPLPTATITLPPTADPNTLVPSCLDTTTGGQIVEGYLQREGFSTLRDAWQAFLDEFGEENLTSSTTDYNNEFAHAVTWQKMLLIGEYPFAAKSADWAGTGYCSVLVYQGGMGPEVGLGITDFSIGGQWSGYASGLVTSEEETRAYLAGLIGKPVSVRYMVAKNPQDEGFQRPGFFSPVMQRLWNDSYYTRIPTEMNLLSGMVGQPRGPSIVEMMGVAQALQGYGVFLEYIVDAVP